jgi:hypothetical protein
VRDGRPQPTWKLGPLAPTLFEACRARGHSTAAAFGDHHLVAIMGAGQADEHWPPDGRFPEGLALDGHGYVYDETVLEHLVPLLGVDGPDLVVGHLNEPDTAAHINGPDSEAALATYRSTDAHIQPIVDALRSRWDDTVLMIVSDHDQETVSDHEPVDLWGRAEVHGLIGMPEGSGGVVWGDDPEAGSWLDGVDGIGGHAEAWPGARVVWTDPGRRFAWPPGVVVPEEPGEHGGANTRNQVAVVAGGHPAARAIGAAITARRPEAADWAPTIASLLGLELPSATGRSLT